MLLHPSGKVSQKAYMNARLAAIGSYTLFSPPNHGSLFVCWVSDGLTIDQALNGFRYDTEAGVDKKYNYGDLKYDIKTGYLSDPR
jgi:hypothetical protein